MTQNRGTVVAIAVLAILGLALGIFVWKWSGSKEGRAGDDGGPVDPPQEQVVEWKRAKGANDPKLETVPEDQLLAIYKPGRKVRSLGIFNITGTGTNTTWRFTSNAHFAYQYRVLAETTVKSNKGSRIVFDQRYPEVSQLRADSDETLELDIPNTPVLQMLWDQIKEISKAHPVSHLATMAAELLVDADPHLKMTLTTVLGLLKRNGIVVTDTDQIEYLAKIDELAGLHLEIEYISGLGVTSIKVLDGQKFGQAELQRLADNACLMTDYFVGKAADESNEMVVRAEDAGGMFTFGYDVTATGHLTLKREAAPEGKPVEIRVVDGDVRVTGLVNGAEKSAHLMPKEGLVKYARDQRLVIWARGVWDGTFNWVTRNHLLFGTVKLRNVRMETYYEAELVDAGTAK